MDCSHDQNVVISKCFIPLRVFPLFSIWKGILGWYYVKDKPDILHWNPINRNCEKFFGSDVRFSSHMIRRNHKVVLVNKKIVSMQVLVFNYWTVILFLWNRVGKHVMKTKLFCWGFGDSTVKKQSVPRFVGFWQYLPPLELRKMKSNADKFWMSLTNIFSNLLPFTSQFQAKLADSNKPRMKPPKKSRNTVPNVKDNSRISKFRLAEIIVLL